MFRTPLAAVDGSEHARRALDQAVDLARGSGGTLTLIAVAVRPMMVFAAPIVTPIPTDEELEDSAKQLLEAEAARVPSDVGVTTVVRVGRPADEILRYAEEAGCDVIVVGSRGLGAARSMLLGSVSHSVALQSTVPVLIVHGGDDDE